MNEITTNTTTTTTFKTSFEAWTTLFLNDHKKIMAERKALKAEFEKAMKEYKEKTAALKKQDEENYAKWLEAQKALKDSRKDAKDAKVKTAEEKKAAKTEVKKEEPKKAEAKKTVTKKAKAQKKVAPKKAA